MGLAALAVSAVILPLAAPALAGGGDGAATSAYVHANYRLVQVVASHVHAIEAAWRGVLAGVRRECPLAGEGSPQNAESTQLSNEVIGSLVLAAVALDRPAGRAFVREAGRLSWSNRGLTSTVHAYVSKVAALVAMPPPRLCQDVRGWAASGFHSLPASTLAFAPRFMSV